MRVDIFVPTNSVEDQIQFYVNELGIFTIENDYGMGDVLLRHVDCDSFCLQLQHNRAPSIDEPLFCISTKNCRSEFERLLKVVFRNGGLVASAGGGPQLLEFPLGQTISLRDASGNLFLITEWHPSAL